MGPSTAPMLALSFKLPCSKSVGRFRRAFTAFASAQIVGSPSVLMTVLSKFNSSMKFSTLAMLYSLTAFVGMDTARIVRVSESTMINVVAKSSAGGGSSSPTALHSPSVFK